MLAKVEKRFHWGRVINTHEVGPYCIVEYAERGADNHPTHPRKETGRTLFHVASLPGSASGESYPSLDMALIGAIDKRTNGPGSRSAYYAFKVLDLSDSAAK